MLDGQRQAPESLAIRKFDQALSLSKESLKLAKFENTTIERLMKGNFDNAVIGPRHIKKYLLIIDQFEYGIEPVGWTEFAKMHLCFHSGVYESDELTCFRASRVESRSNTTLQLYSITAPYPGRVCAVRTPSSRMLRSVS